MSPNMCYLCPQSVQWERAGVRGANPISPSPLSSPIEGEEIIWFHKLDSPSGVDWVYWHSFNCHSILRTSIITGFRQISPNVSRLVACYRVIALTINEKIVGRICPPAWVFRPIRHLSFRIRSGTEHPLSQKVFWSRRWKSRRKWKWKWKLPG